MRDRLPNIARALRALVPVLLWSWSLPTAAAAAEAAWRGTQVTYLAGRSAYIEAGLREGLAEGDTVYVQRNGSRFAALRVSFLSMHRSSCDTLWTRGPLAVGDVVAYRPDLGRLRTAADSTARVAAEADSARLDARLAPPQGRAAHRDSNLRGRLGVRWLGIESGGAGRTSQPAVDLRVDARDGFGGHTDLSLDVRSRRTLRSTDAGQSLEQYSRIYRASVTLRDQRGRRRLTFGRQTSPTLASVSVFDGALGEWYGERYSLGGFSGTQPDPQRYRFSSEVFEAGGFAEVHQAPLSPQRWSLAAGAIASRHGAELERDFAFAQGWWHSRTLSASFAQELDFNHGWKVDAGEPPLAWTSTFASARVPVGAQVALHAGYDNRRNVRLWRDRETPETAFDDAYRQGAWGGASVDWTDLVTTSAEYRGGSGSDQAQTFTAHAELHRATRWHWLLRGRWSQFTSPLSTSTLWTGAAGLDPDPRSHLEFTGGLRRTLDELSGFEDQETWYGVDLDFALGQRWYLNGSMEWLDGLAGPTRQAQAGISVRL